MTFFFSLTPFNWVILNITLKIFWQHGEWISTTRCSWDLTVSRISGVSSYTKYSGTWPYIKQLPYVKPSHLMKMLVWSIKFHSTHEQFVIPISLRTIPWLAGIGDRIVIATAIHNVKNELKLWNLDYLYTSSASGNHILSLFLPCRLPAAF